MYSNGIYFGLSPYIGTWGPKCMQFGQMDPMGAVFVRARCYSDSREIPRPPSSDLSEGSYPTPFLGYLIAFGYNRSGP